MNRFMESALRLYDHILKCHWNGRALLGPDPGVRFQVRIWRFAKSYLRFLPWKDDRYYMQCQGYWIRNNWTLHRMTGDKRYREVALQATLSILKAQKPEGYWEYPPPSWTNRIATVEGCYAALGLLASHHEDRRYWDAAIGWYRFLIDRIGFQELDGVKAVHYFYKRGKSMVPNNTTLVLEFLGELYAAEGNREFLRHVPELIGFLKMAQLESGEFPYAYDSPYEKGKIHFLCYQYNAFQFLDLFSYWQSTKDQAILPLLKKSAEYLATGIEPDSGRGKYNCSKTFPEVTYYTAVLAAALHEASLAGFGDFTGLSEKAYARVLRRQMKNGNFVYSSRNYGVLSDHRSYPRYLNMILRHLLIRARQTT
ncbi:hypothetical protein JW906_12895 [bacterium]|nr:hypothetical protein [bacterium]